MLPGPAPTDETTGMSGMLKSLAMLGVMLLAGLALLLVFDVIPREALSEILTKSLLSGGIIAVALVALAFIARSGKRR